MSVEEMSPERSRAFYKLREAEQQAAKGHLEHAVEVARDALDLDPTYSEVRHWIAHQYEQAGQPRRASIEYQEILHQDRDDEQAWTELRRLDPASADRLQRLHNIAPDPFVAGRSAEVTDDLDDLASLTDDVSPTETSSGDYFQHEVSEDLDDLEDLAGTGAVTSVLGGPAAGAASPAPVAAPEPEPAPTAGPPPWVYEEDLKYRQKMEQSPVFARLLPQIIELWEDDDAWDTAIRGSVHLDPHRHPEIAQVCADVAARLGLPQWRLYVCPERQMISTVTRGDPPTLSLTTAIMNALKPAEQMFFVGRLGALIAAGCMPYLQIALLVLDRTPRTITDVEIDLVELLKQRHSGWDVRVNREDRLKLGQLCHAWQQRAEITADRGGLLCCRDVEVACNAIAKTVAGNSTAAATASWRALAEKYKGQDVGQLAAIPPKEDPVRNEGYGHYRIQMLRWWASTEQGKACISQP